MWVLLSKLASVVAYPLGMVLLLSLCGWLLRFFGSRRIGGGMIFLAMMLLTVASTPKFAIWALGSLERQYPPISLEQTPNAGVIVMLGGALALPLSPRTTAELTDSSDRILHTARLYKAGKAPRVFISGGNVFPEYHEHGEAIYVAELLTQWGVDRGVIEMETDSRTTYQNALRTRAFLERTGLNGKKIILVTSASHMPRAVATFSAAGLSVIPSTTDVSVTRQSKPSLFAWLPGVGALAATTRAWHEYLGIWVYQIRGWA